MDADHHRSVLSLLGSPAAVEAAVLVLTAAVVRDIDMRAHRGSHPRIGALDVVPFVPVSGIGLDGAAALARRTGGKIAERFRLPVYYYGAAATRPSGRSLRELRQGQYEGLAARLATADGAPDDGPARFDPRSGAVLIGARDILVAFNVWLATDDLGVARAIARAVRESSGGLPGVQAIGVLLESRGLAQVAMNLVDVRRTPIPVAFDRVRAEAARRGIAVRRSELVGLAPKAAFAGRSPESVGLTDFRPDRLLDTHVEAALRGLARRGA
jgi:glutamate formiminotransferase